MLADGTYVVTASLAFARVNAAAHVDTALAQGFGQRDGATHGASRSVERGQETVARCA